MSNIILTTKWQSSHSTLTVKDSVATWFSFVWITEHFSAQCENSHIDTFMIQPLKNVENPPQVCGWISHESKS